MLAQGELGAPFIRNYSRKEYRAQDQNWAITQDKRGVMYFGNEDCVLEYDGVSWRRMETANRTIARSLAIDSAGRIYVGAVGDFGYLEPDSIGRMRYVSLLDKVPVEERKFADVWKTFIVNGVVFFQAYAVLFSYDAVSNSMKCWRAKTAFHQSFAIAGVLYVRQREHGLHVVKGDTMSALPILPYFANRRIYSMLPFGYGRVLAATREEGLVVIDGNSITPFLTPANAFLISNQAYCGTVLENGHFAFGTISGGVLIMDSAGNIVRLLDRSSGLQDDNVRCLFQDSGGSLWLALNDGIAKVDIATPMTILSEANGLKGGVIGLFRFSDKLFAGTHLGVFRMETNDLHLPVFTPVSGIKSQSWTFWSDKKTLLVGNREGVYLVDGYKAELIQQWDHSFCFLQPKHRSRTLYVGLSQGLGVLEYNEGRWHGAGTIPGISDKIRTIVESEDNKLWLGTEATGLIRATPGNAKDSWRIERFGPEDGLPSGGIRVFRLANETVFAGRGGLYRFDDISGRFECDSIIQPQLKQDSSLQVTYVAEGFDGKLWMHCYVAGRSESVVAVPDEGGGYDVKYSPLSRLAGFQVKAVLPEEGGTVWFGGADGLVRFDTQTARPHDVPFSASIRRVSVGNDSTIFGGVKNKSRQIVLPYSLNALRIEYAGAFYEDESATEYQALLEGFDKDWSHWTHEAERDYTNLSEGTYRFRIRARSVYGTISAEDSYEFVILPPWYRSWLAYSFYLILFGGCFYGVVRYMVAKTKRRGIELVRREREKGMLRETELRAEAAEMQARVMQAELDFKDRELANAQQLAAINDQIENQRQELEHTNVELKQKLVEIESLYKVSSSLISTISLQDLLQFIVKAAVEVVPAAEKGSIVILNEKTRQIEVRAVHGYKDEAAKNVKFSVNEGYSGKAIREFRNFIVDFDEEDIQYDGGIAELRSIRSAVVAVLVIKNEPKGVLAVESSSKARAFKESDLRLLTSFAAQASIAIENATLYGQVTEKNDSLESALNELKNTQAQLIHAEKMASLGQMVAGIAHEINNPIGFVYGNLEYVKSILTKEDVLKVTGEDHIRDDIMDALETSISGARRIGDIVQNLRTFSKLDEADYKETNLSQDLDAILDLFIKRNSDISIKRRYAKELFVTCHTKQINQCLLNILTNAVQAIRDAEREQILMKGGGLIIVSTAETEVDGKACVRITISDNGIGIPAENLAKLFDPFFTTRPVGQGKGLGLSEAFGIVQKHAGSISAMSEGGKGSEFTVLLPRTVTA